MSLEVQAPCNRTIDSGRRHQRIRDGHVRSRGRASTCEIKYVQIDSLCALCTGTYMLSSRFLTKKVFPVENPSATPLTEIYPWTSLWAQKFLKAPLRGGRRCAPRARAREIATESKKLVRTQNLARNDPKIRFGCIQILIYVRSA